jgi:hypothetical protein
MLKYLSGIYVESVAKFLSLSGDGDGKPVIADENGILSTRRGYKCYVGELNNTTGSSQNVTVSEFENELGSIVWSNQGSGNYTGTLSGAFVNDTVCFSSNDNVTESVTFFRRVDNDTVSLKIRTNSSGAGFTLANNIYLEIKVYNPTIPTDDIP